MLSFEIGQRESCFYSEQTDRLTESQSDRAIQYRIIIQTRETPAFDGISLALRGSGAFGATFRAPLAPIWRRLRRR